MLEYFAIKKFKKHREEKRKSEREAGQEKGQQEARKGSSSAESPRSGSSHRDTPAPVLTDSDKDFLEQLTGSSADHDDDEDEGPRPPLPPRVKTPDLTWDSDSESFRKVQPEKEKKSGAKPQRSLSKRISLFSRKEKGKKGDKDLDAARLTVPEPEVDNEKDDLSRVLDDLNLSARNNKAFSLSADSTELVGKFTLVLKDLVNGVPTAVNDLTSLLDDRDGTLAKNYEKLPKSFKKLVTQLPDKLTSTLAPELLAVAAEAQGLGKPEASDKGGLKTAAKKLLTPKNLSELVTKPGAVVGMLKGIMNALKLRWPAFMGTNVIWSVAIFRKST